MHSVAQELILSAARCSVVIAGQAGRGVIIDARREVSDSLIDVILPVRDLIL